MLSTGRAVSSRNVTTSGLRRINPWRLINFSAGATGLTIFNSITAHPSRDRTIALGSKGWIRKLGYSPVIVPASLKIGKYIDMTKKPTMPPRKTMITGSRALVKFSTAWSTSSS
jgi:hypothetical protein